MKKICALAATLVLFAAIFVGNAPVEAAAYAGFVETNTYLSKLSMAPSIIAELRTEGQAESYAELDPKMRPSNAVVTVDDELNVLDAGGKEIGDFSTVFETLSSEGILTVVRLKNRVQADALSAWLIETDEFDLAAMSSDPAVVKYLKTKEKDIRGIADYSAKTAQDLDAAALVKEANENYCNAVLLSQGAATAETVAFFQARVARRRFGGGVQFLPLRFQRRLRHTFGRRAGNSVSLLRQLQYQLHSARLSQYRAPRHALRLSRKHFGGLHRRL